MLEVISTDTVIVGIDGGGDGRGRQGTAGDEQGMTCEEGDALLAGLVAEAQACCGAW